MFRTIPILALLGCDSGVANDMEFALEVANQAIAVGLLTAEPVLWVDAEDSIVDTATGGARHGPAGDCPEIDRDPDTGDSWTIIANFESGCVSGSGLTPTVLSGPLNIVVEPALVTADYDELTIGLVRSPTGSWAGTPAGDESIDLAGTLDFPKADGHSKLSAELHLLVQIHDDGLTLDGTMSLDRPDGLAEVTLKNVKLNISDIPGECANPHKGLLTIEGSPEMVVDFAGPGDGEVTVQRKSRTSAPAQLCSFASDVF